MMVLIHKQHTANDISRGNALGTRYRLKLATLLRSRVHILPIHYTGIIPMDDVINAILLNDIIEIFLIHNIGTARHDFIHEFTPFYHRQTFLIIHQRFTLAFPDTGIAIDAYDQMRAKTSSETEGIHVTIMHHIKCPVHKYTNLTTLFSIFFTRIFHRHQRQLLLQIMHLHLCLLQILCQFIPFLHMTVSKDDEIYNQRDYRSKCAQDHFLRRQ
mmetsp:Transcript_1477/g.2355  ORF Transcript_1477/g.2355 Transcript_1477/m.2355 type:complete len:214 (+) Transcript_1477:788-1429(+)